MTMQDPLEECRTAAALYSAGALPEREKMQFEQRLSGGCPFCTAQLQEYAAVADQIALTVPLEEPDPGLRERLLNRIQPSAPAAREPQEGMKLVRSGDTPWRPLPSPEWRCGPYWEPRLCWFGCSLARYILRMNTGLPNSVSF